MTTLKYYLGNLLGNFYQKQDITLKIENLFLVENLLKEKKIKIVVKALIYSLSSECNCDKTF